MYQIVYLISISLATFVLYFYGIVTSEDTIEIYDVEGMKFKVSSRSGVVMVQKTTDLV
jgi:hypothetical protein